MGIPLFYVQKESFPESVSKSRDVLFNTYRDLWRLCQQAFITTGNDKIQRSPFYE
jgi:hypothetical protein